MTFKNIRVVFVYFIRGEDKLFIGRLALKDRIIYFEYTPEFLKTGLHLSPFKLPLKPGIQACNDYCFNGLFGLFNDSLPDGWGRLLLDRKLIKLGINADSLSPLDRLCYVGSHGMGALTYEPEVKEGNHSFKHDDLDEISFEISQFQEHDDDQFVDDLLIMNGSSAGARPKILTTINGTDLIIKFRSSLDPKDNGPIEFAYHLMAKEAGLEVPDAKLYPSKEGPGYFGVKRFDRVNGKRLHMHTLSGLLHADHRIPSLDYKSIMQATLWLTKEVGECEKQFRAAVFNVFSHNRDDHAKNFSFLMNEQGNWRISPAYDLIFSSGPSGEHVTTIMGEGKNPSISDLLKLAEIGSIKKEKAMQIIDEVKIAVAKWKVFAEQAGVSISSQSKIDAAIKICVRM